VVRSQDAGLVRAVSLAWALDHIRRRRESIETQLNAAVRRQTEAETQITEAQALVQHDTPYWTSPYWPACSGPH
jgi:hypothetical protein